MVAEGTKRNGGEGVTKTTLSAVGSFIKLLPTGTVFVFQFLNPVVTNTGECKDSNKWLSSVLLVVCGLSCAFSSFTDSYTDSDNKRHYGIVTSKGLWPYRESQDISKNKVKKLWVGDFVHAGLSLLVFGVLGLLDINTVRCFYPGFESTQKSLLQVLPTAIGIFTGGVFMIFPTTRNGIGYPSSHDDSNNNSSKPKETTPPQNPIQNV